MADGRDAALAEAADFEVEARERAYPKLVASGKLSADEATLDFQAWHCIAEWLKSGRSPAGWFDDSAGAGVTAGPRIVVEWRLCEAAAQRAVDALTADAEAAQIAGDAKAARLWQRRADVNAILGMVSRHCRFVEKINQQFRASKRAAQQPEGRKAA